MNPNASSASLLVVHVHVQVKPECVAAFQAATLANARASLLEPGIARFDVAQQTDDPTRFVLVEAYRTAAAPAAHKATKKWTPKFGPVAKLDFSGSAGHARTAGL
jgi:quinol monooxygenase YgiN